MDGDGNGSVALESTPSFGGTVATVTASPRIAPAPATLEEARNQPGRRPEKTLGYGSAQPMSACARVSRGKLALGMRWAFWKRRRNDAGKRSWKAAYERPDSLYDDLAAPAMSVSVLDPWTSTTGRWLIESKRRTR